MDICGPAAHLVEAPVLVPVSRSEPNSRCPSLSDWFLRPDDEKSCMLLVMRVLSIVPLNFKVRNAERSGLRH